MGDRKLYWRLKKNGKWTWTAADSAIRRVDGVMGRFMPFIPEEEK